MNSDLLRRAERAIYWIMLGLLLLFAFSSASASTEQRVLAVALALPAIVIPLLRWRALAPYACEDDREIAERLDTLLGSRGR